MSSTWSAGPETGLGLPRSAAARTSPVLAFCCLSQLMIALDVSVVNVGLPAIRADLGFSDAGLPWVVNAYTIVLAGFLLLGGRAADLVAHRTLLTVGFVVFSGASLAAGLAPNAPALVAARGLQGVGDAILAPATLSLLTSAFIQPRARARALGAWAAASSCGGTLGMLTGGLLTQFAGWQWMFLCNVPVGVAAVFAARRLLPRAPRAGGRGRLDVLGAVTASAGLTSLVYGIVHTEAHGWLSPGTLGPLGAGAALFALFLLTEHRFAAEPIMPLRVFRHRPLVLANLVVFLLGFTMVSTWYFVTLQLQRVLAYSPVEAGLAFVPMTVLLVVCSRLAGPLLLRLGAGWVLAAGMLLAGAGAMLFSRVPAGADYVSDVLAPMLVTASGFGLAFVAVTAAATESTAETGLAAGLVNTTRQVGAALGLALLVVVSAGATDSIRDVVPPLEATAAGLRHALVGDGAAAVAGALLACFLVPYSSPRGRPRPPPGDQDRPP
ncbi:MFS transporter [Amycolatopsis acidiphila]|uniref:MFS transporter n=1 Tax=Amycolatopsis acidiphila TaxID=715473 RepID=UPI001643F96D|nr:MFS transporter [Amycolatopsis acidiphila]UIJ63048.1 MFS transporter [Amycolatopsis acidiphila]GHG65839.1 MFS transporter [Amycolatopsis acidiphila]